MSPLNVDRAWLTVLVFTATTTILLGVNLALGSHLAALGLAFVLGGHLWLWKIVIEQIRLDAERKATERDRRSRAHPSHR